MAPVVSIRSLDEAIELTNAAPYGLLAGIYTADLDTLYTFLENKVAKRKGILQTETFMRGNLFYFSADGVFTPHVG